MYWYLLSLLPYSDTILTKCIIHQMDYPDLISMFPGCIFSYVRWTESAMAIKCLNIVCCKWLIIFSPTAWCHNSAKLCAIICILLHFPTNIDDNLKKIYNMICIKVHKTFEELSIPICDETLLQMLCKSKDKWGGEKRKKFQENSIVLLSAVKISNSITYKIQHAFFDFSSFWSVFCMMLFKKVWKSVTVTLLPT